MSSPDLIPAALPPRLDPHERTRLRTAAFQAKRRYPGAVGELISRELLAVEDLGYLAGRTSLPWRLADAVLKPEGVDA